MSLCCADRSTRTAQSGVALITVMLVFAIATLMASQMLRSSYLAMHRTGNLIDSAQARYYALGAEELGRQMLASDLRSAAGGGAVDHLGEEWAGEKLSFEIEDGLLELSIADQAGRFNLNSLIDAKGVADTAATQRFARLLRLLNVDETLADAVVDWIDADHQTGRGSGEAAAYGADSIPDQPFVEASELRAVPGFDDAVWRKLANELTALPPDTKLNINTATPAVLLAYAGNSPGAGTGAASAMALERFVQARKLQPVRNAQDPSISLLFGALGDRIGVRSDYFTVRAHAEFRGRHVRLETLMHRDAEKGTITILERSDAARL